MAAKQLTERLRDIREDFLKLLTEQERKQFSPEIAALKRPLVEEETVSRAPHRSGMGSERS